MANYIDSFDISKKIGRSEEVERKFCQKTRLSVVLKREAKLAFNSLYTS
jgi:hypothetical protein